MIDHGQPGGSFVQEYIPRVSRTFALTIKFLPRGLRDSVYTSYLLCRVADTLEDSSALTAEDKSVRLLKLKSILLGAVKRRKLELSAASSLYDSISRSDGADHELLADAGRLFEILDTLPVSHKRTIFKWVAEMAGGMAEYSKLNGKKRKEITTLRDIDDWDRYCYYVAGTVGHMLTDLFILHYGFEKDVARGLRKLQRSFGLGLQKVNVLKDVPDDRERGVCYLPGDILSRYVLSGSGLNNRSRAADIERFVENIVGRIVPHLDDAMEYSSYIPAHLLGVRMFLVVPVFLAVETLALVKSDPVRAMIGPAVKISRSDVSRLVTDAGSMIRSDRKLMEYYLNLRNRL